MQNRLAHLDDNASGIPGRELGKLLYGRDSVFARNPTPEQVHSCHRRSPFELALLSSPNEAFNKLHAALFPTGPKFAPVKAVFWPIMMCADAAGQ